VLDANGATTTATGGDAAGDVAFSFENISGSAFNDSLYGNDFANVLKGGDGSDLLSGGGGKDTLLGGADRDFLDGGTGADTINGGAGADQLQYVNSTSGVTVTLGRNGAETIGKGGQARGDKISKVEDVAGSVYADKLIGNNLANELFGSDGDDRLTGGGGNDTLSGGDNNDRLVGGKGDDDLTGGLGNDTFVLGRGFGFDVINDFEEGAGLGDVIRVDKDVFKNYAAVLAASAQIGADVLLTKDANDTIRLLDVPLANLNADDFSFF
jgi:Ca2+-binding RTX toxin-like protein